MRGPFQYKILLSYEHLSENESKIWTRFIEKYPDFFDEVWYDWQVGSFRGNEELNEATARNRAYLGKYKIDVVGRKGDTFYIVEIKKDATTKALGEVWAYEFLFKDENPDKQNLKTMIITNQSMPNICQICEADEVGHYVVDVLLENGIKTI